MEAITNTDDTIGQKILDFMDRMPGLISVVITLIAVGGFYFLG